jgi:ketosteroid isomerase-like protein
MFWNYYFQEDVMILEEMEKRLKTLEDIDAIRNMHNDYIYALASQQWEDMLDCFAEDAVVDIGSQGARRGKNEIWELFKGFEGKILPTHGHLLAQPVIKVDGDTAEGYWIMYVFIDNKGYQGRYECEYVRENGNWKFSHLKYTRPWPPVPGDG